MPERPLARLRARLALHGVLGTLTKAIGDHIFRHSTSVILEARTDQVRRKGGGSVAPYESRLVRGEAELPPLCPFLAPRAADFRAMLSGGKVAVFALRDGVGVGCVWLALTDHHDAGSREHYRVRPGEAYHYCWLADPDERAHGLGLATARMVLDARAALGLDALFGVIDRDNRASYRVHQHFGYRERGTRIRHICLLHTRWTFVSHYSGTLGIRHDRRGRRAA